MLSVLTLNSRAVTPVTIYLQFLSSFLSSLVLFFSCCCLDCEECKERYEGECPLHPFTIIEDKPVPAECENRARLTLPDFLSIRQSGVEGCGEGVWAEKHIPKGVRFGPYAGEIVSNDAGYWSGFAWEVGLLCF